VANLYGDWEKAIRRLNRFPDLVEENMERATKKNATTLRDQMKRTITQGWPGIEPLSPKTIARKGSSKPLIDTGDMRNSIKPNFKSDS